MRALTTIGFVLSIIGGLLLLSGCAADVPPPSIIVLGPVEPLLPAVVARPAPATPVNLPAAVAVVRDTSVLQRRAAAFAYRRDSSPQVIDVLADLTRRMQETLVRLRAARRGLIYRAEDIAAARSAADTLAAYLAAQGPARPVPPPPPPLSPLL